jgi:hypothetical protein
MPYELAVARGDDPVTITTFSVIGGRQEYSAPDRSRRRVIPLTKWELEGVGQSPMPNPTAGRDLAIACIPIEDRGQTELSEKLVSLVQDSL